VNADCLKLTAYFGERDRAGDLFVADALLDVFGRRGLATSVLLRGTEGFGGGHHVHTERLLTASEDPPAVAVAVDTRERIEAAVDEAAAVARDGVVTLERARMLTGDVGELKLDEPAKLTVYCGRQERAGGRPAFVAVTDLLHRHGVAGVTVLLGVDGTARGQRARARFFGRNADVPLMIIAVGAGGAIAAAARELGMLLSEPLLTLERIQVVKRDGERTGDAFAVRDDGSPVRQKLMVHAGEHARVHGRSLHVELQRRVREAGAAGATSLRGIWGYYGDHPPHGDRLLALRRHVPTVTVLVDTPAAVRRWFPVVDETTARAGLVTSELVPTVVR
jgi:PII-like signaling protein